MSDADEELVRALARRQRELEGPDRRAWEAVCARELDAAEVARARAEAGDPPEVIELAAQLFRPYDEDQRAKLMAVIDAVDTERDEDEAEPEPEPEPEHEPGASDAQPDEERASPWSVLGPLLALAAVLALFWALPSPVLPAYAAHADRGVPIHRGADPGEITRYSLDSEFEWTAAPEADGGEVIDSIVARVGVFDASGDGPVVVLDSGASPLVTTSAEGVVRVSGQIADLSLGPGRWEVVIVIARSERALPDAAGLRSRRCTGRCRKASLDIEVLSAPP